MPTIMIVDDDKTTTGLLQTLLELDGFTVVTVPDGATASQKVYDVNPDALLVDVHLSDIDGTDFVREVRSSSQLANVPVIMASGLDYGEKALRAGANRFLIKPFDPSDLVEILQELIK